MFTIRGILTTGLLSLALNLVSAGDPAANCPSSPSVATTALRKKIFCNYDLSEAPLDDTTGLVQVNHLLLPEFFVFDEYVNALEIHGDVVMEWKDGRLAWNTSDYNGLDEIVVMTKEIWIPNVDLSTPARMYNTASHQSNTNCDVSPTGKVGCFIPLVYEAHCNPDVRRWPFDSHICIMMVSTRTKQIDFKVAKMGRTKYGTDKYWRLVSASANLTDTMIANVKLPTILYTFFFERHTDFLIATFFVPAIVMLTATLCVFCLNPAGVARLFLTGANITCHCLFLMYLAWYLPANGDNTPVIMTFFRDSLVLVGVSLLVTVWAATMAAASRAPPSWLSKMADAVRDSPARCLLFASLYAQSDALDDGEPDSVEAVMASSAGNKWRLVTTLIDRVSLVVFAVILPVLASDFLPINK